VHKIQVLIILNHKMLIANVHIKKQKQKKNHKLPAFVKQLFTEQIVQKISSNTQ